MAVTTRDTTGTKTLYGLSSDAKSTTNIPIGSIFHETDTGIAYLWAGSAWASIGDRVYDRGGAAYNVKAYGAVGDGATDDATAINAAIVAANAAGGGVVLFPPGTYIIGATLTMFSHVHLVGSGGDTTILQLKASTNVDVIKGNLFASLTGLNGTGGIHNWSIRDLTIDGNKANNASACYGLRVYGYGYQLHNVRIKNCKNDGLYSEWSSSSSSPGQDSMEAHVYGLRSHDCDGNGVTWKGPHDSQFFAGAAYMNAVTGIEVSGNGSGTQFTGTHNWGGGVQATNWDFQASGVAAWNCISDGGVTRGIYLRADDVQFFGHAYSGAASSVPGVVIGVSAGTAPARYDLNLKIENYNAGAISFVNDGGHGRVRALIYQGTDASTPIAGFPLATTDLDVDIRHNQAGTNRSLRIQSSDATMEFDEDFVSGSGGTSGSIGQYGFSQTVTNSGAGGSLSSTAGHPGQVQRLTGATSASVSTLHFKSTTTHGIAVAADLWDAEFTLKLDHNDANTTLRVGWLSDAAGTPSVDGAYFEKLDGDTNWFSVTRAASVQTRADSGVATTTASWVRLRVRRVSATQVGFSIDGGTEVLAVDNLPTAAIQPIVQIINSAAASKTLSLDRIRGRIGGLVR